MLIDGPLPDAGGTHEINADAERCLRVGCPPDWRLRSLDGSDDYGLDFNVQTTPKQQATDVFRLQLKGTRSPEFVDEGRAISVQFKATTVRYLSRLVEPVLIVVCDLSSNPAPTECAIYYVWVRDELERLDIADLPPEQKYVNLRVPTANVLRGADLSADLRRQNEASRAGRALELNVDRALPGRDSSERLSVMRGIAASVGARGATFVEAIAAPAAEHWVDPPRGSLAWMLLRAKADLARGAIDRASSELAAAEELLDQAAILERAEFYFLRGKLLTAMGDDGAASRAFLRAHEVKPGGRYLAGWAEAEIRSRYDKHGPMSCADMLDKLIGDGPEMRLARSRIFAAEGRIADALAEADSIEGPERHAARALALHVGREHELAAMECQLGLSSPAMPESSRQMLLVLRARSRFAIAEESAPRSETETGETEYRPPPGRAGIDAEKLQLAAEAIEEAVECVRDGGWSSNIEHLADVWAATASTQGKQRDVLHALAEAARKRPHLRVTQTSLESLAAQVGDFATALEANARLPESPQQSIRKVLWLHESGRHVECVQHFERCFSSLDPGDRLFGPAVTALTLSAERLAREDLVARWTHELEARDDLREHAALLRYWLRLERRPMERQEALEALMKDYESLDRPFGVAVAIFHELDATNRHQASIAIETAERILAEVEATPTMAIHLGMALATTEQWEELLSLCIRHKERVSASARVAALEALALDRLGRTEEARRLLETMLDGGLADTLALNTYVDVSVRCGFVPAALAAAEKILEVAKSDRQRKDCVRLLFILTYHSDPGSPRLLTLARRMGALANASSEAEEGLYLMMFIHATMAAANKPSDQDREQFQLRSEAFFAAHPNSKVIRRVQMREEAPAEELIEQLRALSGVTRDREEFQTRLEAQLRAGTLAAPFSWRPRLMLSSVQDVAHLWAISKASGRDDRQYHLTMLADAGWSPLPAASLTARTPLLDITALLILFDLGLMEKAVRLFGKIAIAKATLETLAEWVHPFSCSPARIACAALQDELKRHLTFIIQPSASYLDEPEDGDVVNEGLADESAQRTSDLKRLRREDREIAGLTREQSDSYRLYSDDLAFRIFCGGDNPDGFCTADVIGALEERGLINRKEAAECFAKLCGWNVGLVVRFEDLLSVVPEGLATSCSARQGLAILDASRPFVDTIEAIWDFRGKFAAILLHGAAVLRRMVDDLARSEIELASLMAYWFVKAGLKSDAPAALELPPMLAFATARIAILAEPSARRLWNVHKALVEFHHGDAMDERREREAIRKMGEVCAKALYVGETGSQTAYEGLRRGLTEGASEESAFSSAYSETLVALRSRRR